MQINILTYSDISNAPDSAVLLTAIQEAVFELESTFLDPITITIVFGWGEVAGQSIPTWADAASSRSGGVLANYSEVRQDLINDQTTPYDNAAVNSLSTSPWTRGGTFFSTIR